MGRFLNTGNEAFSEVIHSEIYVDKTPLLEYREPRPFGADDEALLAELFGLGGQQ